MKVDLAVIGQGAVSPAGIGVAALTKNPPTPSTAAELRRPEVSWPVLRIDQKAPELLRWQEKPRLRRASPLTLYLIEAAEQALAGSSSEDRAQTGLIIVLSAGCLVYSRRFFEGIINEGRHRASPALFPETVFNSPGSHVAAALQLNGAAYALVGDESALVGAILTATIWLREERVHQVLVLGGEEFDAVEVDAYRSAGWLRRARPENSFLPSEGASALLLRSAQPGDHLLITAARDGYIYRTKPQAAQAAQKLFASLDPAVPCYPSATRTWLQRLESRSLQNRRILRPANPPDLGQAFVASAAWHTILAAQLLSATNPRLAVPLWGLNHQLSVLELLQRR